MTVLKDDSTIFSQRIKKQKALKKFEQKVKLMETNWDEFCLLVNLFKKMLLFVNTRISFYRVLCFKFFFNNPSEFRKC